MLNWCVEFSVWDTFTKISDLLRVAFGLLWKCYLYTKRNIQPETWPAPFFLCVADDDLPDWGWEASSTRCSASSPSPSPATTSTCCNRQRKLSKFLPPPLRIESLKKVSNEKSSCNICCYTDKDVLGRT